MIERLFDYEEDPVDEKWEWPAPPINAGLRAMLAHQRIAQERFQAQLQAIQQLVGSYSWLFRVQQIADDWLGPLDWSRLREVEVERLCHAAGLMPREPS